MSLMTASPAHSASFEDLPTYRAPQGNRQSLVTPPIVDLIDRCRSDRSAASGMPSSQVFPSSEAAKLKFGKWTLEQVRAAARSDAMRAAIKHTASYRDLWFDKAEYLASSNSTPWLVAGHQPELFHTGVWFKNFLLSHAGQEMGIVPLNLIIDNDLCRAPAVRVLTRGAGPNDPLRTENVLFDAPASAVAWECRPLADLSLFDTFPERVGAVLLEEIEQPLVRDLWKHARPAARRTGRLGLALAEARHALEGALGLRTLELPLSHLCEQESFARFSIELLRQLPRFQQIYNAQRAAYRTAHGIRSESHPVPALAERHGWLEAPWWIYRHCNPARKHLFAKLEGDNLVLSDQAGWQATIEGPLDDDDAMAQWQEFAVDGVLLRPRALITTMFVRLVVSDLFLHGIGGGMYDQLTDAIIREFFGIEPPPMCVATATLHLPQATTAVGGTLAENHTAVQHEIEMQRRLRHHPEEHVAAPDSETQALLREKQELLKAIPPRGEKWEWHRKMARINERLVELNRAAIQQSEQRVHELAAQERQLKLAYSRELSFCQFELPYVVDALDRLAAREFVRPAAK